MILPLRDAYPFAIIISLEAPYSAADVMRLMIRLKMRAYKMWRSHLDDIRRALGWRQCCIDDINIHRQVGGDKRGNSRRIIVWPRWPILRGGRRAQRLQSAYSTC